MRREAVNRKETTLVRTVVGHLVSIYRVHGLEPGHIRQPERY